MTLCLLMWHSNRTKGYAMAIINMTAKSDVTGKWFDRVISVESADEATIRAISAQLHKEAFSVFTLRTENGVVAQGMANGSTWIPGWPS